MTKSIVIDASVVAKWLLYDEQGNVAADQIKADFISGAVSIVVTAFIFYEVNNLLRSAALSNRLNSTKAKKAYEGFLDLNFKVYSSKELLKTTLEKAFELAISSYDASYVVLAEYLQIPLYTADDKLVEKAQSKWAKRLDEYPNGVVE